MRTDYPSNLTYYYQDNHEGSVTHLMLANGTVIESYRYDAFGAPTITTAQGYAPNNRFMFTRREYIKQFAIYEYRARAYHPGIGRFVSEDPKGFDGGDYNLFRYCKNDPLDLTDPMGLQSYPDTSPIGASANQDKNMRYYKLHPSSFTDQLLTGPGVPATNGTGGPWQSTRSPLTASMSLASTESASANRIKNQVYSKTVRFREKSNGALLTHLAGHLWIFLPKRARMRLFLIRATAPTN